MYLLIDCGNTSLKYRIQEHLDSDPASVDCGVCASVDELLEQFRKLKSLTRVDTVLLASVREQADQAKLMAAMESFGWDCFVAETSAAACGVSCGYPEPQLLGIDRWLAIIAAYHHERNIAVIDMGTAITFDIVQSDGEHLGGHIIPGEALLNASLKNTGRVRVSHKPDEGHFFEIGHNTSECVSYGIESLLESYLSQLLTHSKADHQVENWIFTGGSAYKWMQRLASNKEKFKAFRLSYNPDIVFAGLIKLYQAQRR